MHMQQRTTKQQQRITATYINTVSISHRVKKIREKPELHLSWSFNEFFCIH